MAATVKILDEESNLLLFIDPVLKVRARAKPQNTIGKDNVIDSICQMGSEDVVVFGIEPGAEDIPVATFWLDAMDSQKKFYAANIMDKERKSMKNIPYFWFSTIGRLRFNLERGVILRLSCHAL